MVEERTIGGNGKNYPSRQDSVDLVPVLKSSIVRNNGRYSIARQEVRKILSGEYEITPGLEVLYIPRNNLEEMFAPIYSIMELKSYDKERHIGVQDAYQLVESQNDSNLSSEKLRHAVKSEDIRVYKFKGQEFLDRLDIGRVYHQTPEKRQGLKLERHFTKKGEDPFASVEFGTRDVRIDEYKNGKKTGNIIFEMKDAEFPALWNDNQASVVAQKYFFRPDREEWKEKVRQKTGREHEYSLKHLINRVTHFIADEGFRLGYFATEEDRGIFADELKFLQVNRKLAFNSPVQFNAGIFNEYEIPGSQGIGFWRNPETGKVQKIFGGEQIHPQSHACFIKGPRDDLESIMRHSEHEGAVFSLGSGIGQDIGALRAETEPLSGGGRASGPLSFWEIYDKGAGTIKSGGKSRRAARMSTMRYQHPDIMKFIRSKVGEDKKVLLLMRNGYGGGMDGEAVRTAAFQNTNISVRLDDYFFEQLKKDGEVELKWIKSGEVAGKISAKRMLQEISYGSWRIGDPAVQYESKIQEMHTAKNSGRINSSNPCSEYMFLDDTSCNLNSHNLSAYADEKGNFNTRDFSRGVFISTIAADIFNDSASYPIEDIAMISPEFRTIGVGYAGLGTLLMRRGLAYDSDEGRALAGAITALMTGTVYEASAEMAEKLGTFTHFEFNKRPMIEVMEKHRKNLEDVLWGNISGDLKEAAYNSWNNVIQRGREVGFRNAQATVLAPTGTISYLLGSENSTGVEPSLSLLVQKNLAGGGNIFIANDEVPNALNNLGYSKDQIREIINFINEKDERGYVRSSVIGAPHLAPDHYSVFATAFGDSKGNGSIPFEGHIKMLAATQPFISGAISKTNNLPENATVKNIYDGFVMGYDLGLKAVAVFRNNSKPTQAVGFGGSMGKKLERGEKEDLPYSGNSFRQEVKIGGTSLLVEIGEYVDGRPGEVVIESYNATSTMGNLLRVSGVMASDSLKRGVSLEKIVKSWIGHKIEEFSGMVTIDEPKGPHPYIKTALSPLDFVGKLLLLHYKGRTEFSAEPEKVKFEELRGHTHGAFKAYKEMEIDDWDVNQVLNDPELGGFTKKQNGASATKNNGFDKKGNNNDRGNVCNRCGNLMHQTAPGCFDCKNCGDKVGGCGM